ncbi:phosphatase PAP2 family protein [Myroides odoratus]|uniref:phosphatase PAP2 family protein n=1 Tax=Myroides odoratus TaxID=256 RepID=UPI0039AF40B1
MLALIPCSLLIVGMKNISNRPRPTSDLVRVMEPFRFQSFPSSHVFSYTLFFGLLLVFMCSIKSITKSLRITLGVVSGFFLVLISPSRIYLGAHWFTDTLGGVLFGSLVLLPLSFFYFKINREANS